MLSDMDGIVMVVGLFRVKLTNVSSLLVDRVVKVLFVLCIIVWIEISPEVDRITSLVVISLVVIS